MTDPTLFNIDLCGKTAFVGGASAGIGEATARVLASLGARVIGAARSEEKLKKAVASWPGRDHRALVLDLSDHDAINEKVGGLVKSLGSIDILINNSAGPAGGALLEETPEKFFAVFNQHLIASQLLAQLVVPGMKTKQYGRIVNVISTSVRIPIAGLGVSNTIRGAVASWAKTLANEVGPFGITVNSVLPGFTMTDRHASLLKANAEKTGKTPEQIEEQWRATVPARRFGEPAEVAAAIAYLASPVAGYVNGVVLPVDGGRTGSI